MMIRYLLVLLVVPWLTSCLELREEVWIEADGSGRMAIDYSVPTRALAAFGGAGGVRGEIESLFDEIDGLDLDEVRVENVDSSRTRLRVAASAPSMLDLLDLRESEALTKLPPSAAHFMGEIEVGLDGLNVEMHRRLDLKRGLGLAALGIDRRERETRRVTYIVHLPVAAGTHNATRTENGGRTLIWEHTLGDALTAPLELEFRSPLPIPRALLIAAGLVVGALAAAFVWLWKKRRARKASRLPAG
jgi:hypothetical protein